MAKVKLFYRDANNYKSYWEVQVPDEIMRNLPDPDPNDDGMHDISCFGLTMNDIPLIKRHGYDKRYDHPFVTVEGCTFDNKEDAP